MCLILIALRDLLSVEHVKSGTMGNVYGTDVGGGFINTPSDVVNGTTDYPCFFPCRENRVYDAPGTVDDLGVAQDFCGHMQTRMAGWYALMQKHHEKAGLVLNGTCSIPYEKGQTAKYTGEKNHIFEKGGTPYGRQIYYSTPASDCYVLNSNSTNTWGAASTFSTVPRS